MPSPSFLSTVLLSEWTNYRCRTTSDGGHAGVDAVDATAEPATDIAWTWQFTRQHPAAQPGRGDENPRARNRELLSRRRRSTTQAQSCVWSVCGGVRHQEHRG